MEFVTKLKTFAMDLKTRLLPYVPSFLSLSTARSRLVYVTYFLVDRVLFTVATLAPSKVLRVRILHIHEIIHQSSISNNKWSK